MPKKNRFSPMARAMGFATMAHYGQLDKAGKPYIDHPIAVANLLILESETVQIAALLHDVVEDTPAEIGDIHEEFGKTVADAVEALTRGYTGPDGGWYSKKRGSRNRKKEAYKDFILRCKKNSIAARVKIADVTHNLSRMGCLSQDEQEYLLSKYSGVVEFLMGDNATTY